MKKIILTTIALFSCLVMWAGTGTGTSQDPYADTWSIPDLAARIKVGDTISLNCTIMRIDAGYGTSFIDDKLNNTKIIPGWAEWNIERCLREPFANYQDYIGYNSDWHNHVLVVTKVSYTKADYVQNCLTITGHYTGYYSRAELLAELETAWNNLPDSYKDATLTQVYTSGCDTIQNTSTAKKAGDTFVITLNAIITPPAIETISSLVAEETSASLLATAQTYINTLNDSMFHKVNDTQPIICEFTNLYTTIKNAIAEITAKVENVTNTDILTIANTAINNIYATRTVAQVNKIKSTTLAELDLTIGIYNTGKTDGDAIGYARGNAEGYEIGYTEGQTAGHEAGFTEGKTAAFGTMGEKQNGPAVIVTDQDGKQIILYSPKKVQYIKVSDK